MKNSGVRFWCKCGWSYTRSFIPETKCPECGLMIKHKDKLTLETIIANAEYYWYCPGCSRRYSDPGDPDDGAWIDHSCDCGVRYRVELPMEK